MYAELSWDLEKAALQLDKLQSFFLAGVEVEHAALHAFSSPACLASFRLVALPAGLQQRLAALVAQVRAEAARAAAGAELSSHPSKAPVPGEAAGLAVLWWRQTLANCCCLEAVCGSCRTAGVHMARRAERA